MHPAYSVILFTTASGAGYGLLIWMALAAALGLVPPDRGFGFVGLGIALSLVTVGLLSSTFHLGRPERAWRALSQWRTSWLSREGVLALATYVPAAVLGIAWVFFSTIVTWSAWALALLALATVVSTGMIYASLTTIRAWNQPLVTPVYVLLALATGGILFNALLIVFYGAAVLPVWLAIAALLVAWLLKVSYWSAIDGARRTLTASSAIGLGRVGGVRPLDPPHSTPNFVMREMGYKVARKHASKLRTLSVLLLFAAPALGLGLLLAAPSGIAATLLAVAVLGSAAIGVWIERWLFFAEAQHVVTLYYGADTA
ncbi:MAG: hypothetical protein RLZ98_1234 [Pseudomonadota bacterium]|jgi:DMSO reductase anchor subunit